MRTDAGGDGDHLRGRGHFEVEGHEELALQPLDILSRICRLVLAQMRGDAVGPREHRRMRGPDRVRLASSAAGVPQGRDVVDVDAEADGVGEGMALFLADLGRCRSPYMAIAFLRCEPKLCVLIDSTLRLR